MNEQGDAGRIVVRRDERTLSVFICQLKDAGYWARVTFLVIFWLGITISCLAVFVQTFRDVSGADELTSAGLFVTCGVALVFFGVISYTLIWTLLGRERVIVDECSLTLVNDLRVVRWKRTFPLSQISNIRWRERRVARKGGSFLRRTIAFDVAGKTVELRQSQLSYPEANRLEALLRGALDARRERDCSLR